MRHFFCAFLFVISSMAFSQYEGNNPIVAFETNVGKFEVELYEMQAPATVNNFMQYINEGFYKQTIFHRVIKGFMIQGGAYDSHLQAKSTHSPIESESQNGLKNSRGTIAMARSNLPHSATSQFFINLVDNNYLDAGNVDQYGYTVFGKVIKGMDTIDKIADSKIIDKPPFKNLPISPIIIESATLIYDPHAPKTENKQEKTD